MFLILSNTPISKHYFFCLNDCLATSVKKVESKFYVKIYVTKHDVDPNSYISKSRKTAPMTLFDNNYLIV